MGTAPLSSGGEAAPSLPGLRPGRHAIVARYLGDANFSASASPGVQFVVGDANARFLNRVFLDLLGRPIDWTGLAVYEGRSNSGTSRSGIVLAVEGSREFALTTVTDLSRALVGQEPAHRPTARPSRFRPKARPTRSRWKRWS